MGSFSVGGERQWSVTCDQWSVKAVGKGEGWKIGRRENERTRKRERGGRSEGRKMDGCVVNLFLLS